MVNVNYGMFVVPFFEFAEEKKLEKNFWYDVIWDESYKEVLDEFYNWLNNKYWENE